MLHPRNGASALKNKFAAVDIENRQDGSVLAVGYYDGVQYRTFDDWGAFLAFLPTVDIATLYAHNGSGWDWLSLLEYAMTHCSDWTFDSVQNGSRLVCIMFTIEGRTFRLLDSASILQCKLDVAAEKFLGKRKTPLDHLPEWYYTNDRATFDKYLYNDCTLLYDVMQSVGSLIYQRIAKISTLGITLPSTALKCFQTGYLHRSVSVPDDPYIKECLRNGYTGGRVEVFKPGLHYNVRIYDYNSLYPSVMLRCAVPVTGSYERTDRITENPCGFYRIRFCASRSKQPLLFTRGGAGAARGEGWYYAPEVLRALRVGYTVDMLEGWQPTEVDLLFSDYVSNLYALRMEDKDGPLGAICKLLLNSLYGKFGQRSDRTRTLRLTPNEVYELVQQGKDVDCLSDEHGIYRVTEDKPARYEHVGIAGVITSEARGKLWDAMDEHTVYVDTDSVHTTRDYPTSSELGGLKLEFQGQGVYVGKKLYALRGEKDKVRAKGIRIGGELGCGLSFDDLCSVSKGAKIECLFRSASTLNEVMKGKQSCRMNPKKRTIRATT